METPAFHVFFARVEVGDAERVKVAFLVVNVEEVESGVRRVGLPKRKPQKVRTALLLKCGIHI